MKPSDRAAALIPTLVPLPAPAKGQGKKRAAAPRRVAAADGAASPMRLAQFDLFPVKPIIDVLDPRVIVGPRTGVEHLVRVRLRPNDAPHLIFHDRHGWYCESHGPTCHTVQLARDEIR